MDMPISGTMSGGLEESQKLQGPRTTYHQCARPFSMKKAFLAGAGASVHGGARANSSRKGSYEKGHGGDAGKAVRTVQEEHNNLDSRHCHEKARIFAQEGLEIAQ